MILRDRPGMLDVLFAVRGTILPCIAGRLVLIAAVTVAAVAVPDGHPGMFARLAAIPFTLIGLALSIFGRSGGGATRRGRAAGRGRSWPRAALYGDGDRL